MPNPWSRKEHPAVCRFLQSANWRLRKADGVAPVWVQMPENQENQWCKSQCKDLGAQDSEDLIIPWESKGRKRSIVQVVSRGNPLSCCLFVLFRSSVDGGDYRLKYQRTSVISQTHSEKKIFDPMSGQPVVQLVLYKTHHPRHLRHSSFRMLLALLWTLIHVLERYPWGPWFTSNALLHFLTPFLWALSSGKP